MHTRASSSDSTQICCDEKSWGVVVRCVCVFADYGTTSHPKHSTGGSLESFSGNDNNNTTGSDEVVLFFREE